LQRRDQLVCLERVRNRTPVASLGTSPPPCPQDRVAELRSDYQVPQGFGRTEYRPGELAQWDLWFPPVDVPVGHGQTARLPVIVGVPGFSRWILAR